MPPSLSPALTRPAAVAAALAAMLANASVNAADYVQTRGSALAFSTQYEGMVFTGRFPDFQTRLHFDPDHLESAHLDVTIPLASALTGNSERDSTLKTSDFFNIARFAQARYTATGFRALGDGRYAADGTLQLKGIEKPVTLTFHWEAGAPAILTASAIIQRLDFEVGIGDWSDTGTIPNEVSIAAKVRLRPLTP